MYGACVNVWHKLHCCMVAIIFYFSRLTFVCKKKYVILLKNCKTKKIPNEVFKNNWHVKKYYEVMENWTHHRPMHQGHVTFDHKFKNILCKQSKQWREFWRGKNGHIWFCQKNEENVSNQINMEGMFQTIIKITQLECNILQRCQLYWRRWMVTWQPS